MEDSNKALLLENAQLKAENNLIKKELTYFKDLFVKMNEKPPSSTSASTTTSQCGTNGTQSTPNSRHEDQSDEDESQKAKVATKVDEYMKDDKTYEDEDVLPRFTTGGVLASQK